MAVPGINKLERAKAIFRFLIETLNDGNLLVWFKIWSVIVCLNPSKSHILRIHLVRNKNNLSVEIVLYFNDVYNVYNT